jgi:hypothetical protein
LWNLGVVLLIIIICICSSNIDTNVKFSIIEDKKEKHSWFYYKTELFFSWMENSYTNARYCLWKTLAGIVIMIVSVFFICWFILHRNLYPPKIAEISGSIQLCEGTSFDAMDRYYRNDRKPFKSQVKIRRWFVNAGGVVQCSK